jgi:hypothetical protein
MVYKDPGTLVIKTLITVKTYCGILGQVDRKALFSVSCVELPLRVEIVCSVMKPPLDIVGLQNLLII